MQEFRRVHHHGRTAGERQRRDGGVARVVGAPHPREHERAAGQLAARGQAIHLLGEAAGGTAERLRLTGYLGDEWVRKVS
jgi:hypothetical protein